MAKTRCPQCDTVSPVPDNLLGRKVRCKKCNAEFVAASIGPSLTPGARTTREASDRGKQTATEDLPPVSGADRKSAASITVKPSATPAPGVVTVVARPVAARRGARAAGAWAAAVLAFVIPVTAAACFVLLNWASGTANETPTPSETYGVIEVGAKSVKYTVFKVLAPPGGDVDFVTVVTNNTNTALGDDLKSKHRLNAKGVEETCSVTRASIQFMRDKHGLGDGRIFLVASEDLFGPIAQSKTLDEDARKQALDRARSQLTEALRTATGKQLDIVSSTRVAQYQLRSLIPARHRADGVYLDIGGSGTRGGYLDGVILRKLRGPGVNAAKGGKMSAQELRRTFRTEVENSPGFEARRHICINGGIIWVAANVLHPTNRSPKLPLTAGELRRFADQVRGNPDFLRELTPPAGMEGAERKELEKEFTNMRSRLKHDYLVGGCAVLLALVEELKLEGKELTFIRNSDFAWVLSYAYEEGRKDGR